MSNQWKDKLPAEFHLKLLDNTVRYLSGVILALLLLIAVVVVLLVGQVWDLKVELSECQSTPVGKIVMEVVDLSFEHRFRG